jgi:hypothetical protein
MKTIEEMTIEIKRATRESRGVDGRVVELAVGNALCAITQPHIPECRTIRINGTWYRKCEDFDAEYQDRQFRMQPTEMDF